MCGIAGFLNATNDSSEMLERQIDLLLHRGPDSVGVFGADGARIGQSRLRVIDLVTGDPPISNEDGTVGVALNGEIYNFQELRGELEARGHVLKTRGDTEVIAHMSEDLDPVEVPKRLDGMFAYAVWDVSTRRLSLARDPLGKKPLYYWTDGRRFVFGSEIKALLMHPDVPRRLDESALGPYLTYGFVPTPSTFFEGIRSVTPGCVLTVNGDGTLLERPYWSPCLPGADGATTLDLPIEELAPMVRSLLGDAVDRRLVADVPVGAFLSGGIDSTAVVALMAERSSRPVRTFTMGFEDPRFDERPVAAATARHFGTDHHEFILGPAGSELLEKLVWHYDEPFGDSSAIPTYLLAEQTRKHVTVALSGDGGDEVFGGYERFSAALALGAYRRAPAPIRNAVGRFVTALPDVERRSLGTKVKRFVAGAELQPQEALLEWQAYIPHRTRAGLHPQTDSMSDGQTLRQWGSSEGANLLDRLLHLNLTMYLRDDLLPKLDRMSMAHALEIRSPLLDRRLVDTCFRLPASARVRAFSRKRVLHRAVADLLPKEVRQGKKRGFGIPLDGWLRNESWLWALDRLSDPAARVRQHLDGRALDAIVEEHRRGIANHGEAIFPILTLELFLDKNGW